MVTTSNFTRILLHFFHDRNKTASGSYAVILYTIAPRYAYLYIGTYTIVLLLLAFPNNNNINRTTACTGDVLRSTMVHYTTSLPRQSGSACESADILARINTPPRVCVVSFNVYNVYIHIYI